MRLAVLILMTITLSACNKADKAEVEKDDAYGEYEIADPRKSRGGSGATTHVVEIVQMKFVPDVINATHGDTVIWVNKDLVQHDVTELNTNSWSSSPMATGSSWKMVFQNSEIYNCSLHVVMTGKIIVDGNDIPMNLSSAITMCDSPTDVK
jgi:plastocyanin